MHMFTITRRFIYEFTKIWCLYFGFPGRPRLNADCWLSRQLCRLLLSRQTLTTIHYSIPYHTLHIYCIVWIPFTHLQYYLLHNTCTIVHVVSAAAAANRRWQWQGQVNLVNLLPEFLCWKKTSRKRVKVFYFSLFTSRKKWKLSIFHYFFSRKNSEIRCGL